MNDPHDILDEFRLGLESFSAAHPAHVWPTPILSLICRLTQRIASLPRPEPQTICTPAAIVEPEPPKPEEIKWPRRARIPVNCMRVWRAEDGKEYISLSEAARDNKTSRDEIRRALRHGITIHGYHFTDVAPQPPTKAENAV